MPTRVHIIAILLIIAVPLALMLFDSRWNTQTYRCDGARTFTLLPNFPGYTNAGEVTLEGQVIRGEATIAWFPGEDANAPPQTYTAWSSAFQSYAGDMYAPVEITFDTTPRAECELRLTYRLKSGLSLVNPLW